MNRRNRLFLTTLIIPIATLLAVLLFSWPASASIHKSVSLHSVTPKLNTNVICQPGDLFYDNAHPWVQTRNGPASFGCGGYALQVTTPTSDSVSYYPGNVDLNAGASYSLRAFITQPADAIVDYQIYVGTDSNSPPRSTCVVNQNNATIGWNSVCSLTVNLGDFQQPVTIDEWSGQASPRTMSASAIQFLPA